MTLDSFIDRWSASGDAERTNKDSFLNELCDVLGVERPHPKTGDPRKDLYVFEKDVPRTRAGSISVGRARLDWCQAIHERAARCGRSGAVLAPTYP